MSPVRGRRRFLALFSGPRSWSRRAAANRPARRGAEANVGARAGGAHAALPTPSQRRHRQLPPASKPETAKRPEVSKPDPKPAGRPSLAARS